MSTGLIEAGKSFHELSFTIENDENVKPRGHEASLSDAPSDVVLIVGD